MTNEINIKVLGVERFTQRYSSKAMFERAYVVMQQIIQDAGGGLSELTIERGHVGVYSKMAGSWLQTTGVETNQSKGSVLGFLDPEATAPYVWVVVNGTQNPHKLNIPFVEMEAWIKLKITDDPKEMRRFFYFFNKKRKRERAKGDDFVTPFLDGKKDLWSKLLSRSIAE